MNESLSSRLHCTTISPLLFRPFILSFPVSAFLKNGAKKAATVGGQAASEPARWDPHIFPQGAPLGATHDPRPPAQHLFLKPKGPPCSPGIRVFRPACRLPGTGISGTGNGNVAAWPLLKGHHRAASVGPSPLPAGLTSLTWPCVAACSQPLCPHLLLGSFTSVIWGSLWVQGQLGRMPRFLGVPACSGQ